MELLFFFHLFLNTTKSVTNRTVTELYSFRRIEPELLNSLPNADLKTTTTKKLVTLHMLIETWWCEFGYKEMTQKIMQISAAECSQTSALIKPALNESKCIVCQSMETNCSLDLD